jgi:hypothetical protein
MFVTVQFINEVYCITDGCSLPVHSFAAVLWPTLYLPLVGHSCKYTFVAFLFAVDVTFLVHVLMLLVFMLIFVFKCD